MTFLSNHLVECHQESLLIPWRTGLTKAGCYMMIFSGSPFLVIHLEFLAFTDCTWYKLNVCRETQTMHVWLAGTSCEPATITKWRLTSLQWQTLALFFIFTSLFRFMVWCRIPAPWPQVHLVGRGKGSLWATAHWTSDQHDPNSLDRWISIASCRLQPPASTKEWIVQFLKTILQNNK